MRRSRRRHRFTLPCALSIAFGAALACLGPASAPAHAQPAGAAAAAGVGDSQYTPVLGQPGKDVIWVPTSQSLVDGMLDVAKVTPRDRVVDLGSGDGRTVITAARRGIAARGIEYNGKMVELARRNAAAAGVSGLARFEQGDIFKSDFSEATVVTLFLLPELNMQLRPTLLAMPAGTRVVSNSFTMGDWAADQSIKAEGCSGYCTAYFWIVPAKVAGHWKMGDRELVLTQQFQEVEGHLDQAGRATPLRDVHLSGADIRFRAGDEQFSGRVIGNEIWGTIDGRRDWRARRLATR